MKKDLHPSEYRPVVVKDLNTGDTFLTRSTAKTGETIKWEDGKEYPLLSVHISSASHPFYTGQEKLLDVEGRVDKFHARQKAAADRREARSNKAKKAAKQSEETKDEIKQKVGGGSHQGNATKKIAKEAQK